MFDYKKYEERLISDIGIKRYKHCLRVMDCAIKLSEGKEVDLDKVKIASFLHDCAKYNEAKYMKELGINKFDEIDVNLSKPVIHSFLGAELAKKVYNIRDKEILEAIKYHTTGKEDMTILEKIVFMADAIEEGRSYPGVEEIRKKAFEDLDEGVLMCLDHNIKFLIDIGAFIDPLTLNARNYLIREKNG
ncbi:bis(5'-nucleosyl)-tetraphosphatase (symmetrical) YqeK [uncultured Anaerococcus sp.]|uniref:bis(5'-nucleosyl)-tetraphosphatase (symmetrical) YqeK n=1 Tax=uncultured Anaerococcus sp. TaxID=293428 RepID=UPI002631F97B|nr:bis(5'-nucleosyl)-tetraphosphatase (symmetrical) YqeK [uncultured Anaerococcus sp.]